MRKLEKITDRTVKIMSSNRFFYILVSIFIVQCIFIAIFIKLGVAPDESHHFTYIQAYSSHIYPIISNQNEYFSLGDIERNPSYLYHYLLSFPYRLIRGLFSERITLVLIRLINVGLGALSLLGIKKIGESLSLQNSNIGSNLAVLTISALPMFILLSSSVNYDNATIALSIWSMLMLIKLWKKGSIKDLLWLLVFILAGSIIKYAFLPLALTGFLIGLFIMTIRHKVKLKNIFSELNSLSIWLLILLVLTLGVLGIERHGLNYLRYKSVRPNCALIHTEEECLKRPIYARSVKLAQEAPPTTIISKDNYIVNWLGLMRARTFGVLAHKAYNETIYLQISSVALSSILLIAFIKNYRLRDVNTNLIITFSSLYMLTLVSTNYNTYASTGRLSLAVQGRYLFPALFLILPVLYAYYSTTQTKVSRIALLLLPLAVGALGGLPALIIGSAGNGWWVF